MAGQSLTAAERREFDTILGGVLEEVRSEVLRAIEKHGHEAMAMPGLDVGKRLGILGEEYGEVCRATTYDNGDPENLLEELVQTAAMAVSWKVAAEFENTAAPA